MYFANFHPIPPPLLMKVCDLFFYKKFVPLHDSGLDPHTLAYSQQAVLTVVDGTRQLWYVLVELMMTLKRKGF